MSAWSGWQIVRHQVAVAGRVTDSESNGVPGAEVTLTMQTRRETGGADRAGREPNKPFDRTSTNADGIFFFLDSPAAEYAVECVSARSGLRDRKTVSVRWRQDGTVERAVADLKLKT